MGPQLVVLCERLWACLGQLCKALKTVMLATACWSSLKLAASFRFQVAGKKDMLKYRRDSCGNASLQGAAIARKRLWRRTAATGRPQACLTSAFQRRKAGQYFSRARSQTLTFSDLTAAGLRRSLCFFCRRLCSKSNFKGFVAEDSSRFTCQQNAPWMQSQHFKVPR